MIGEINLFDNMDITTVRRYKNGKVKLTTTRSIKSKRTYVISGPVTFVSITYRLEDSPRKTKKKQKTRGARLGQLLRRCLPTL